MTMTPQEIERRLTQHGNEITSIYEMLSVIGATQGHHGHRLNDIDARLGTVDAHLDGIDSRLGGIDGRLDGIDGQLGGIDGRLDGMDGRLERLETGMTELLRRLPG